MTELRSQPCTGRWPWSPGRHRAWGWHSRRRSPPAGGRSSSTAARRTRLEAAVAHLSSLTAVVGLTGDVNDPEHRRTLAPPPPSSVASSWW